MSHNDLSTKRFVQISKIKKEAPEHFYRLETLRFVSVRRYKNQSLKTNKSCGVNEKTRRGMLKRR